MYIMIIIQANKKKQASKQTDQTTNQSNKQTNHQTKIEQLWNTKGYLHPLIPPCFQKLHKQTIGLGKVVIDSYIVSLQTFIHYMRENVFEAKSKQRRECSLLAYRVGRGLVYSQVCIQGIAGEGGGRTRWALWGLCPIYGVLETPLWTFLGGAFL